MKLSELIWEVVGGISVIAIPIMILFIGYVFT